MKTRDALIMGLLSGIIIGIGGTLGGRWLTVKCDERKKRKLLASQVSRLSEMVGNQVDAKSVDDVMRELDSVRETVHRLWEER